MQQWANAVALYLLLDFRFTIKDAQINYENAKKSKLTQMPSKYLRMLENKMTSSGFYQIFLWPTFIRSVVNVLFTLSCHIPKEKLAVLNNVQYTEAAKLARKFPEDAKKIIFKIAETEPQKRKELSVNSLSEDGENHSSKVCRQFLLDIKKNSTDVEVQRIKECLIANNLYSD